MPLLTSLLSYHLLFFYLIVCINLAHQKCFCQYDFQKIAFPRTFNGLDGHYGLDGHRGRLVMTRDHGRFLLGNFPSALVHALWSVRSVPSVMSVNRGRGKTSPVLPPDLNFNVFDGILPQMKKKRFSSGQGDAVSANSRPAVTVRLHMNHVLTW